MAKINPDSLDLKERVVSINPVSKVTKGGRTRSFRALVVVGDEEGHVGGWAWEGLRGFGGHKEGR